MSSEKAALVQRLQQHSAQIKDLLRAGGAPGLSLGVFHHGEVIYTQHFGQRDIDHPERPDDESVYMAASTFKVVTACALACLVSDNLLEWDVPIREYLPKFRQRKDQIGLEVTVRDLMSNRAGLPMAHFYWGQQNAEQLIPKEELERFACHVPNVQPFRSQFLYSQWGFILIQILVETISGKSFGDFVREVIFEPLGLETPTYDDPQGTNVMTPHAVRNDGQACKIKLTSFSSATGLAAGIAKSNTKDQLNLYIHLLHAYNHQTANNVDTTPGSPFKQLRTIFTPQTKLPGTQMENQAYCLGLYRTRLPGNLSCASLNGGLPRDRIPIFGHVEAGKSLPGEYIWHHSASTPGFMGAMFLVPETNSGVVVHTNATSLLDTADFTAQLLLSTLLDVKPTQDLATLSRMAVQMQLGWFKKVSAYVESCKTDKPPTHPLPAYAGTYWNATRDFKIVLSVEGSNVLRASIQGLPITHYNLRPCDGDTFYWTVDRELELVELGTWFHVWPQYHFVKFRTNEKRVLSLTWQHDKSMKPETFDKEIERLEGRL